MIDKVGEVATTTVDALKSQPLVLGFIVLNVLFLCVVVFMLMKIANATEQRDILIRECIQQKG